MLDGNLGNAGKVAQVSPSAVTNPRTNTGTPTSVGRPVSMEGFLSVSGLKKAFGSRKVVKDVSLFVRSGEVVGLLGPNGAGKTTSFYMIVG